MKNYSFTCNGHPNITGTHPTTLEFTKDKEVTLNGDCIIGVNATFSIEKLRPYLTKESVTLELCVYNHKDTVFCKPNDSFSSDHELVIRLGTFESERTFGINANKAAKHLSKELIQKMKDPKTILEVTVK